MKYKTFALIIISFTMSVAFIGIWGIYTSRPSSTSNTSPSQEITSLVVNMDSPYTFNFNYSNARATLNEEQDLSLFINSDGNKYFRGAEIFIEYDPLLVTIDNIEGSIGSFDIYTEVKNDGNILKIAGFTTEDKLLNFGVEILRLKFKKISPGSTQITIKGGTEGSQIVNEEFDTFGSNETILTISD